MELQVSPRDPGQTRSWLHLVTFSSCKITPLPVTGFAGEGWGGVYMSVCRLPWDSRQQTVITSVPVERSSLAAVTIRKWLPNMVTLDGRTGKRRYLCDIESTSVAYSIDLAFRRILQGIFFLLLDIDIVVRKQHRLVTMHEGNPMCTPTWGPFSFFPP